VTYFKEFDNTILRPILIYKYSKERKEKQFELFDMMQKKGQKIEKDFASKKDESGDENKDDESKFVNTIRKHTS
jgi:hypothetical protein